MHESINCSCSDKRDSSMINSCVFSLNDADNFKLWLPSKKVSILWGGNSRLSFEYFEINALIFE